jgi:hypothetical protein
MEDYDSGVAGDAAVSNGARAILMRAQPWKAGRMGERNLPAKGDRAVARRAKTGSFGGVLLGFATDAQRGSAGCLTGGRCATRTRGLWFRRPTLYPPELIAHEVV